ncbi:TonB family protein [candidate division WOR-3 bacterium]|nr:TonB family protein [candidate division WOR-3 bacterium]
MASFMGLEISPHPRDWLHAWWLAISNTARGFGEIFANKRLWVGLAVSVALHGLIFFLSLDLRGRRVSEDLGQNIDVIYDPTLPPKAQQLVQQQEQFMPGGTADETAPLDISKGKVSFQSQIEVDEFSLDKGQASLTGDVIRINPNARLSTEEILAQAPIDISRSVGGTGAQNPFDQIASGVGSSIELDSKATQIGSQVEKPKFEKAGGDGAAKQAVTDGGAKKSTFSLSGDLSPSDIITSPFPVYPPWARQKGLTNVTVTIRFAADAAGNVLPTMIVAQSTGYPNWDSQVKSALARWKFKPADGIGKRNATITFRFILT